MGILYDDDPVGVTEAEPLLLPTAAKAEAEASPHAIAMATRHCGTIFFFIFSFPSGCIVRAPINRALERIDSLHSLGYQINSGSFIDNVFPQLL